MSQGDRLARTLQRIGCPKAKHFTGESLEWLFENQPSLPFLEWFCDNISGDNVLSEDELTRYEELVSSGEGILEGDKLTEALSCAQGTDERVERSIDAIREEIESLKRTSEQTNKRLQKLVFHRNKLSLHQTRCAHQLSQVSGVEKQEMKNYKKCLELSQVDSNEMDLAISNLQQIVCDLTSLYTQQGQERDNAKVFLSQMSYQDFFDSEEKFTSELTLYTKKQFFEGIADMAGRGDKSRYDLLEISDPTALLIRGESEEVTMNDCKELARLQSVFALSESKRIDAEASRMGVKTALSLAKEKDRAMLRHHHVIDQLLLQRSRYEFLSMTLEVEAHKHRDIHRLLCAVESGLQHLSSSIEERINKMSEPALLPLDARRGTIDSRDVFVGHLHKMLKPSDTPDQEGQLFLTYNQLVDWSSRLIGRVQELQYTLQSTQQHQENTLRKLEVNVQQCQKAAYGGSTTAGGLPQLTPQRLGDSLVQLEEVLSTLEQSIKDIIKDVEGKKKVLRSDNLKAMKRELFVCFFTDTSRLRRAIAELAARVDAQIVSTQ
ncbi:HAUS augmin-like complex subunit 3 [Actinia tenebrosa]|uniref:HAUS augmin-like complex subunit 3 n=1 Tax=Actinia tenebrosa TaxID=6105 RepID=A0A6P8HKG6_ACTTE|nr:HAUS augmin-like complex subunit 3 [Actinia tenebrosa]